MSLTQWCSVQLSWLEHLLPSVLEEYLRFGWGVGDGQSGSQVCGENDLCLVGAIPPSKPTRSRQKAQVVKLGVPRYTAFVNGGGCQNCTISGLVKQQVTFYLSAGKTPAISDYNDGHNYSRLGLLAARFSNLIQERVFVTMQGTLNEIDIRSILQLIELGQRTGELLVEAYSSPAISTREGYGFSSETEPESYQEVLPPPRCFWFVFFINGQIAYAADSEGSLLRLRDYLRRYRAEAALDTLQVPSMASTNALEYGYLWALLENHVLTTAQGRSIIESMVHETLFDLLSLHQGSFIFEIGPALAPQLTSLEIAPKAIDIMKQVQAWKQFHPHIQSPNQCPVIADFDNLSAALPKKAFNTLKAFADGKTSLRQLARYFNRDILTVAGAIYPYVQQGWVQLLMRTDREIPVSKREFVIRQIVKVPHVVCIEDDVAIGKAVEYILKQQGYQVTTVKNPLKALSLVFEIKPDLILCDIAMPQLDGYEICAMLRQSTAFRQVPIVMLTGREGFIDRLRARMVGATDYLTKPFGESELLMLIEKYIGSHDFLKLKSDISFPEEITQTNIRVG